MLNDFSFELLFPQYFQEVLSFHSAVFRCGMWAKQEVPGKGAHSAANQQSEIFRVIIIFSSAATFQEHCKQQCVQMDEPQNVYSEWRGDRGQRSSQNIYR